MSDSVLSRGTIELVVDARRVRAGIEEARKSIRSLGEGQRDISKSAQRSIDQYIGRLELQARTVGKTTRETELYKLALRGASNEQINAANSALLATERQQRLTAGLTIARTAMLAFTGAGALFARNTIANAAALDDMAEKTGASVDSLSRLNVQARISGTQFGIVEDALIKLGKGIQANTEGSEEAERALAALGLQASELRGLDTGEALRRVAVAFNEFSDTSAKSAAAIALFGKSGAQVLPFLKDLANDSAVAARATAEQAAKAEELEKATRRLTLALTEQSEALVHRLVPSIADWAEANTEALRIAGSLPEALRLFVFNLDAMTSEKPREEIERLTKALEKFKAAGAIGRFIQSPTGAIFGGREEDLRKQIEFLKFLERQQALSGRVGPQFLDARDLKAAQKQALDFQATHASIAQAELALVRSISQARERAAEVTIARESLALQARLAGTENLIAKQAELQRFDLESVATRTEAAERAYATETRLAERSKLTAVQKAGEQITAAQKYYDSLVKGEETYQKIFIASRERILALDQRIADSQKRTEDFVRSVDDEGLTKEQRVGVRFRELGEAESGARSALLSGNTKELERQVALGRQLAEELRGLGAGIGAIRFVEAIGKLEELGDAKEKLPESVAARTAQEGAQAAQKQIAAIEEKLRTLQETALKDLNISVSDKAIAAAVTSLREAIAAEKFTVNVTARISEIVRDGNSFSDVPQIQARAAGGMIHGPGGPTGDRIPALLSDGEFVVRSSAVRNYGADFFHQLNAMRFAQGGSVGSAPSAPARAREPDMVVELRQRGKAPVRLSGASDRVRELLEDLTNEYG